MAQGGGGIPAAESYCCRETRVKAGLDRIKAGGMGISEGNGAIVYTVF